MLLKKLKPGLCDDLEWRRGGEEGEASSWRRGHMHAYDWFMLMDGRDQHSTVRQLSLN